MSKMSAYSLEPHLHHLLSLNILLMSAISTEKTVRIQMIGPLVWIEFVLGQDVNFIKWFIRQKKWNRSRSNSWHTKSWEKFIWALIKMLYFSFSFIQLQKLGPKKLN